MIWSATPTGSVPKWKQVTPKPAFSEAKPHPLARAASHLGVAFTNNDENNE